MKKRKGFTLIELVIVVAILGTLSSIALVKFSDVGKQSKVNSDYVTANNIATAAKLALNSNDNISKLDIKYLVENNYLESIPKVQSEEGKEFKLEISDNGKSIKVLIEGKIFYPKDQVVSES